MSTFGNSPFGQPRVRPLDYGMQAGSPTLVAFFNAVYAWMAAGLGLTAVVAWWASTQPEVMNHLRGPMLIFLVIAELGLVITISAAIQKINATAATVLFLIYAALNGLTLSVIFLIYAHATLAGAFIASAAMFGTMSVYGMVTKSDLSGLGKIAFMGLIGVIVASIVNMFLANTMLTWIVSYIGVAVFVALTAYDTQKLKQIALQTAGDAQLSARLSINGALILYLDFLNLFLFMVQIMGDRRR
jgi:FtsH-binding integral membrane protein